jgi:hypothetical protein
MPAQGNCSSVELCESTGIIEVVSSSAGPETPVACYRMETDSWCRSLFRHVARMMSCSCMQCHCVTCMQKKIRLTDWSRDDTRAQAVGGQSVTRSSEMTYTWVISPSHAPFHKAFRQLCTFSTLTEKLTKL